MNLIGTSQNCKAEDNVRKDQKGWSQNDEGDAEDTFKSVATIKFLYQEEELLQEKNVT